MIELLGFIAIGVAFVAGMVAAFLLGRASAPKPHADLFAEQPLHPRPVAELEESLFAERTRVGILADALERIETDLEQVTALYWRERYLRERHWRSLKRLRTRIRTAPVHQLYPRLAIAS